MTPTYEQMLEGATKWIFNHKGISFQLSHHGYRGDGKQKNSWDYDNHPGIWCYYIFVSELQYPESWPDFRNTQREGFMDSGKAWFSVDFYGGITWVSDETFYDRKVKRRVEQVKVGCDYNHLWDTESGYYHSMDMVKSDAINSVEDLLRSYPLERVRCFWTGKYVKLEETYTAINGAIVFIDADIPEEYTQWKKPND